MNPLQNVNFSGVVQTLARFFSRNIASARQAHLRLGRRGERLARYALEESGMEFLCSNFRCRQGEIDLVFREEAMLCFVEVKTRHKAIGYSGVEAVNEPKQKRILAAARHYLKALGNPKLCCRYDVVEVTFEKNRLYSIRHWPGAFGKN